MLISGRRISNLQYSDITLINLDEEEIRKLVNEVKKVSQVLGFHKVKVMVMNWNWTELMSFLAALGKYEKVKSFEYANSIIYASAGLLAKIQYGKNYNQTAEHHVQREREDF